MRIKFFILMGILLLIGQVFCQECTLEYRGATILAFATGVFHLYHSIFGKYVYIAIYSAERSNTFAVILAFIVGLWLTIAALEKMLFVTARYL